MDRDKSVVCVDVLEPCPVQREKKKHLLSCHALDDGIPPREVAPNVNVNTHREFNHHTARPLKFEVGIGDVAN